MAKTKIFKGFLLFLIICLTALPFYLVGGYLVLGYKFAFPDYSKIESDKGITSILILGKGGEGHTAPDLTDTIINVFMSRSNKINLLSIHRDIWIPEIRAKINSAYFWDKQRKNESYELTKLSVASVTGISPDYIVVVNFAMFEDLVDILGGIEVVVETSFVDEKFPVLGKEKDLCNGDKSYACRYEIIFFEKGTQNMGGTTALKFVRSRNSESDEGTDLAREKRQQKVIDAIKNKLLSNIMLDPKKTFGVLDLMTSNIETNIDIESAIVLARMLFDSKNNIGNLSISEEFLTVSNNSPKYDYQYVFLPKEGSWEFFSTTLQNLIY